MPRRLKPLLLALWPLASAANSAVPAGCERVAQASIATLAAPRYHQQVTLQGGPLMELLRVDARVWQRSGGGIWQLSEMGPATFERAAHEAGGMLARCERTGSDRIDGTATEAWRVTLRAVAGQPATLSQMWVGASDGRIYRNRGAGVETTVRYQGVTPPP